MNNTAGYRSTPDGAAAMLRHSNLVGAAQEAIDVLAAPFAEGDEIPGNIADAIEILRAALKE